MIDINKILASLAEIFSVFKPYEKIQEEKAERRDIKNTVRSKWAELKKLRLERKIKRQQRKLNKK
jgi:hypothetical protein